MDEESAGPSSPPPPKKKKYSSKFQESWLKNSYTIYDGIKKSHKGETFAHCIYCRTDICVAAGGKNDIDSHIGSKKHKTSVKALSATVKSGGLTQYMAVGTETDSVIKAETMWIVHQNFQCSRWILEDGVQNVS